MARFVTVLEKNGDRKMQRAHRQYARNYGTSLQMDLNLFEVTEVCLHRNL